MKREVIDGDELAARMAALGPVVHIIDTIADGKIVCESATEEDFGPAFVRTTVYAMNRATFEQSLDLAYLRNGRTVHVSEGRGYDLTTPGVPWRVVQSLGSIVQTILTTKPGGGEELREWKVSL